MPDDEKGKFSTEIGQDVIDAAMKSVEKPKPEADQPKPGTQDEQMQALQQQLELSMAKGREMLEKLKEEHERVLRSAADLDNYRKRAQKEKDEILKFGTEKLLKEFLPILDNLDRALEHGSADLEGLKSGVAMTRKLFEDTLAKHGVKVVTAMGTPFDPRLHEAMQQVETTDVPPNQVVSELVRGYTLNDRLIRPALVAVSKAPEGAQAKANSTSEGAGQAGAQSGDVESAPKP